MSFQNKVVIVTGASSGIGASTAIHFAKLGAETVIVARNEAKLNQVAAEISKYGKKALIVKADLEKDDEVKNIIDQTLKKFGKIDVLVNNAGMTVPSFVGDDKYIQAYDKVMNTNLRPVVLLTSLSVPHLKKTKGNIVNVSSIAGETTYKQGTAIYSASKAALNLFSQSCATELADHGIRVNIVSPGPVNTNFIDAAGIKGVNFEDAAKHNTALKILTQPEEVAEIITFLASDKAKSVTGSNYRIDAGSLIKGH